MSIVPEAAVVPQTHLWANIPIGLRQLNQWCVAGPDKAPMTVDGRRASSTDASTWTDFDRACRAALITGSHIGVVLTAADPFACVDLDVKGDTPSGEIQRFESIVAAFDSYTERSRSGLGWHVLVEGNIGRGRKRDGVEIYSQERFIICTGNVASNRPVVCRQEMLENMIGQMPAPAVETSLWGEHCADWKLAERAAADGGEMGKLFAGDWEGRYRTQSEADLALIKLLVPHSESPRECWLTFRQSKLGERTKADRNAYAKMTIAKALEHLANDAASIAHGGEMAAALLGGLPAVQQLPRHLRVLRDSELDQLPPLRWLVKRIIPDAGIGAIYGDSGTFKSFLTLDALAHIANGQEWFGHRTKVAPAVYVPFEGQGGIPNRIKAWRLAQAAKLTPEVLFSVVPPDNVVSNIAIVMDSLNLREAADRDKLVATLVDNKLAGGVLCIDTLAHASNGIDENSSAMGEMIGIFRDLQMRLGGVILLIHHAGKDQSKGMRGWSGLHAAMDFVIECQHEKDAGHHDAQFLLTKVKDGATGRIYGFTMQHIQLGIDEDGDAITSLIVVAETEAKERKPQSKTRKGIRDIDADTSAADDQFLWNWTAQQVSGGNFPSKNSLKSQLPDMKETGYEITQDRVLAAVERLLAEERLMVEKELKSPTGNVWIRPVETTPLNI